MTALPFHFGSPAEFAAVREFLTSIGYGEPQICERLGIGRIHDFRNLQEGRPGSPEVTDALDAMIRLFLDGALVVEEVVARVVPASGLAALRALRLLDRHPAHPAALAASIRLYPVESLYLASDCSNTAPGLSAPKELQRADAVFPAFGALTGAFLQYLPRTPCDQLLDLCSGTGIAALAGGRHARHAWAVDITERSTRFAEFNAQLNAIDNVTARRGDLYQPVAGLTFDRIVAHPPYVPASGEPAIFRDGGEDGENVLRAIVAGLPLHLRPRGCFYATAMATDRIGAPLETRLRAFIGERQAEFDLLLAVHSDLHPSEWNLRLAIRDAIPFSVAEERHRLFQRLGAERWVYCSMVIRRHSEARPPVSLRRRAADGAGEADAARLLGWATDVAEAGPTPAVLDAVLRLSPHARLHLVQRPENGQWRVASCRVEIDHPFPGTLELAPGAATLLPIFDGTATVRAQLARLREAGSIAPDLDDDACAAFLGALASEGMLEVMPLETESDARQPQARRGDAPAAT